MSLTEPTEPQRDLSGINDRKALTQRHSVGPTTWIHPPTMGLISDFPIKI
jgi:hypothetical protein